MSLRIQLRRFLAAAAQAVLGAPVRSTHAGGPLFIFRVKADPEPDVFARIANIFNIANRTPHHATLRRDWPDVVQVTVAIELSGVGVSDMIRRKLEQLTSTISVDVIMGYADSKSLGQL